MSGRRVLVALLVIIAAWHVAARMGWTARRGCPFLRAVGVES